MYLAFLVAIWQSNAPWKTGLRMNDPNYLPVPPIFGLVHSSSKINSQIIFGDFLSIIQNNSSFMGYKILNDLNLKTNVSYSFYQLRTACRNKTGQACLILGRIYEFGAYGTEENHKKAFSYYQKALDYGDKNALIPLSFYHRYYDVDIPVSIVETDSTAESVESLLSSSFQYEKGFLRPLSCPTASQLLVDISSLCTQMKAFPTSTPLNQSEVDRLINSTDPKDLYKLGLHEMSVFYPSRSEYRSAKSKFKKALQQGHLQSASAIARIQLIRKPQNTSKILSFLRSAIKIKDPEALLLASDLYMTIGRNDPMQLQKAYKYVKDAARTDYPPAIHKLGQITYYGLLGVPRSNTEGYKLFKKAATKGFAPSMFDAAQQLLGGDGVTVDCQAALSMLRRIIDVGPWSLFFDKYVERGSKHAFLKMLDMKLTPIKWVKIEPQNEAIRNLLEISNMEYSATENAETDETIEKMRLVREGDAKSLLWLIMKSPLEESLEWIQAVEVMPPKIAILAKPLKWFIIAKNSLRMVKNQTSEKEQELLKVLLSPYLKRLFIVLATVCLVILVAVRFNIAFSD
ncbi:sel1 repeat family protein [Histomonas meleagridis]|uniref:sel1 repeat family protein n=1 Tax=Histomonas meleagridis TaxID=135588 RepID=UPI00355AC61F|nr:sel1 repeat family protein [Histomonas meleagridis]KAH0799973.1 sel1 repeat family protein [Histomonas meleagridis]